MPASSVTTATGDLTWQPVADEVVVRLNVAYHADLGRVGEAALLGELERAATVGVSRTEPLFCKHGESGLGRPLEAATVSRRAMRVRLGGGQVVLDPGDAPGPLAVDGRPLERPVRLDRNALESGVALTVGPQTLLWLDCAKPRHLLQTAPEGLVGTSDPFLELVDRVRRTADLDKHVLILGETGSGKEVVAAAIHALSRRAGRIYSTVNAGVIQRDTAAAALFGHVRGAFTGAVADAPGYFQAANRGTRVLDEIGDAPAEVQVGLLRALQSGEVQPVGARAPVLVDVRVLGATQSESQSGTFRRDLAERFDLKLVVPPLGARRGDIPMIFLHFLRQALADTREGHRLAPGARPWLPMDLVAALLEADLPGNVRTVRQLAYDTAIENRGESSFRWPSALRARPTAPPSRQGTTGLSVAEVVAAYEQCGFAIEPAARALGVKVPTLYDFIRRTGALRLAADLSPGELEAALVAADGDEAAAAGQLRISPRALRLLRRGATPR